MKELDGKGERQIVLDCSVETLVTILKQAQQVGLITSTYSFFVTSLVSATRITSFDINLDSSLKQDLHTVDLEDYKYSGTNITGLRLVDINKIKGANLTKGYSTVSRNYNPAYTNTDGVSISVTSF